MFIFYILQLPYSRFYNFQLPFRELYSKLTCRQIAQYFRHRCGLILSQYWYFVDNNCKYKIVLIPQDQHENQHFTYHHYLNLCEIDDKDDFETIIKRLNNQNTSRNRDNSIKERRQDFIEQNWADKSQSQRKQQTLLTRHSQRTIVRTQQASRRPSTFTDIQSHVKQNLINSDEYIPCLFLPGKKDKIIVFFHANAQDITSSHEFLKMINNQTQYSILAMQYRGYSINGGETNPQLITKDANRVISYLLNRKISNDQIIIFGRSIGCAIALGIMKEDLRLHAIVLLSPFLSLKKIAKQLYGNCAGWALKQGFDNQKNSLNINSPLLLIHGMKDTLVPYEHSLALFSQCKSYCQLKLIQKMSHSRFNFRSDFIRHFQAFINELQQQDQQ